MMMISDDVVDSKYSVGENDGEKRDTYDQHNDAMVIILNFYYKYKIYDELFENLYVS